MARFMRKLLPAVCGAFVMAASANAESYGIWSNPSGSVHVEIRDCGDARCASVVWANDKAKSDAAKGGTAQLIGTQILRNFRRQEDGRWKGRAFVPDLDRQFTGYATILDENTIEVESCVVGRLLCRSQIWTRVP